MVATPLAVSLFAVSWTLFAYFFNSILSKRFIKVRLVDALVYISAVTLAGVFGEVFIDTIYTFVFSEPLWIYHLWGVHNSYTSYFSIFIWGFYGFHLYLFHTFLEARRISSELILASIISLEALLLEILFNVTFFVFFGFYIFYYLPNDLWHITSLQAIPFYFAAGFVITKTVKRFKRDPIFFAIMSYLLVGTFVFFG